MKNHLDYIFGNVMASNSTINLEIPKNTMKNHLDYIFGNVMAFNSTINLEIPKNAMMKT